MSPSLTLMYRRSLITLLFNCSASMNDLTLWKTMGRMDVFQAGYGIWSFLLFAHYIGLECEGYIWNGAEDIASRRFIC